MNTRGEKLWLAFCSALLCWGVVSCGMRVADDTNGPKPDRWANWARYCEQVGGTYVAPPPQTLATLRTTELARVPMPECLRPDGSEMTFTPDNRDNLDVEPAESGEPEPFR